jgi:hypothetical protein
MTDDRNAICITQVTDSLCHSLTVEGADELAVERAEAPDAPPQRLPHDVCALEQRVLGSKWAHTARHLSEV